MFRPTARSKSHTVDSLIRIAGAAGARAMVATSAAMRPMLLVFLVAAMMTLRIQATRGRTAVIGSRRRAAMMRGATMR